MRKKAEYADCPYILLRVSEKNLLLNLLTRLLLIAGLYPSQY